MLFAWTLVDLSSARQGREISHAQMESRDCFSVGVLLVAKGEEDEAKEGSK